MSQKNLWIWETYFIILILFTLRQAYNFFMPGAPAQLYFYFLSAFEKVFLGAWAAALLQVLLNLLHLFPVAFYIYRKRFLSPVFWQYMLLLRAIFDFLGHPYEWQLIISLFHDEPSYAVLVLAQSAAFYIPSYLACYRYAFATRCRCRTFSAKSSTIA